MNHFAVIFLLFIIIANLSFYSCEIVYVDIFDRYIKYIDANLADYVFNPVNDSSIGFLFMNSQTTLSEINVKELISLPIKKGEQFKIILHGYLDVYSDDISFNIAREYKKRNLTNIILVDWAEYSLISDIFKMVLCSLGIGKVLGDFIITLNTTLGVPYEDIHLIGPSVAAHFSAFAAKHVKNETGYMLGRISAPDPASLLFTHAPSYLRLEKEDALFVDVIHSDREIMGCNYVAGHADFYPNNGVAKQPHCKYFFSDCNHQSAVKYFTESINSKQFVAYKCDAKRFELPAISERNISSSEGHCEAVPSAIMGEHCETNTRGQFFLTTNANPPYATGT